MRTTEYITPNCCEKAKITKVVRLGLYPKENDSERTWKKVKPKWYIAGDEFKHDQHWVRKIEIDKCPFCGEELPDIEINNKIKNIAEGDEEYCRCCGERHMACVCFPPEYRWKINERAQKLKRILNK
jgi:hypothetical protein